MAQNEFDKIITNYDYKQINSKSDLITLAYELLLQGIHIVCYDDGLPSDINFVAKFTNYSVKGT